MIVGFAALGHPVPSGTIDTLILGWERHFTLDCDLPPADRHRITVWDYDVLQS